MKFTAPLHTVPSYARNRDKSLAALRPCVQPFSSMSRAQLVSARWRGFLAGQSASRLRVAARCNSTPRVVHRALGLTPVRRGEEGEPSLASSRLYNRVSPGLFPSYFRASRGTRVSEGRWHGACVRTAKRRRPSTSRYTSGANFKTDLNGLARPIRMYARWRKRSTFV